ncbi:MAG: CPBP family intramembrane glutamic endopeptidase, partial [Janthinobacterium lividum]
MAPESPRLKPRQRSGNPAVRGGAQAPRTTSSRRIGPPPKEFVPGLLPADGVPYPLALRNAETVWWRSVMGAIFGLSLYLLLVTLVSQLVVRVAWTVTHPVDYRTYYAQALAYERPIGLFAANLGIATLIPISLALVLVIHHARTHWLFSVRPGMRWRYLLACLAVSAVVFVGIQAVIEAYAPSGRVAPQPGFGLFLAVIVLTSPVQAAAEEIFFRGYLMQALGSAVARPWFGVVTSALVFALLHGTQNLALFVNRLAFGLLAGLLVWLVGGLEAGIAAHILNNLVAFGWAGLTTGIAALRTVQSLTWAQSGIQILAFVVCAALTLLVARLMRLRTRVDLS